MGKIVRLGTRNSKLALQQTHIVKTLLQERVPDIEIEVREIKTTGDMDQTRPLSEIGGKGVFIKEIEQALERQEIDIAIHSLKDITSEILPTLHLSGFLQAESSQDVLVLNPKYQTLPEKARIATGSMRRRALLKRQHPDIQFVEIRGNVPTRIQKLDQGEFDGLILSEAGLIRLKLIERISKRYSVEEFCPAPGQGVIALETRKADEWATSLSQKVNHREQEIKSTAELTFLRHVGFDCRAPLGIHVEREMDDQLSLRAFLSNLSLTHHIEQKIIFNPKEGVVPILAMADKFLEWRECHG